MSFMHTNLLAWLVICCDKYGTKFLSQTHSMNITNGGFTIFSLHHGVTRSPCKCCNARKEKKSYFCVVKLVRIILYALPVTMWRKQNIVYRAWVHKARACMVIATVSCIQCAWGPCNQNKHISALIMPQWAELLEAYVWVLCPSFLVVSTWWLKSTR